MHHTVGTSCGSNLPIVITMGCAVSIGPEIILRFFQAHPQCTDVVVAGDPGVLRWTARHLGLEVDLQAWRPGADPVAGQVPVLAVSSLDIRQLRWGHPDRRTGEAMAAAIVRAVALVGEGQARAMTTCPIAKNILNLAGYDFPGHTEMLAHLTQARRYLMMMAGERLRVVLVTIHEPLARVSGLLSRDRIRACIELTREALQVDFGIRDPCIAVAALNPHGGEQGMFGREEEEIIAPAVAAAGGLVQGPLPPDSVFYQASQGKFDAVVAMYHDQGLIPFKLLHFTDGVNVTLGLPLVRTSVDHGTAYDIAGQGRANPASLEAAVRLARQIAANREAAAP